MNVSSLTIRYGKSRLAAIPAIHFRAAFASHVHRICYGNGDRPDAVAVELEPAALSAVMAVLRRYVFVSGKLPCMLGLARIASDVKPHLAHMHGLYPSGRQPTASGSDTDLTSPDSLELLPVSPIDSIVEAVRCALELHLPVYPIDLDIPYPYARKDYLFQDPHQAWTDLESYVQSNAAYAATVVDEAADPLREAHMAGTLKTILGNHRRVLYTGGIGHWKRLERSICSSAVQPLPVEPSRSVVTDGFKPAIIHPAIAVQFMDLFPSVVDAYERLRCNGPVADAIDFSPFDLFHRLIQRTYRSHFHIRHQADSLDNCSEDLSENRAENLAGDLAARTGFEAYLTHQCMVGQRLVPDFGSILHTAQETMSAEFCKQLSDSLMDFEWAAPRAHPDLPVLVPMAVEPGSPMRGAFMDLGGHRSDPYVIRIRGEGLISAGRNSIPWQWNDEKDLWKEKSQSSIYRGWPPTDYLLSALSVRARELNDDHRSRRQIEPFEGSMYEGIDIKATLRSHIRGEDSVYVRRRHGVSSKPNLKTSILEPTVYLFRTGKGPYSEWFVHSGRLSIYHRNHMKDPAEMDRVANEKGGTAVGGLSYVDGIRLPPVYTDAGIFGHYIRGILAFIPPCFNGAQEAHFMEKHNFSRNPLVRHSGLSGLLQMYRQRHDMALDLSDWPTSLVRMAIPYAEKRVTVIAPDGFMPKPRAFTEAAQRKIGIDVVPLSSFPEAMVRKVSSHLFCSPIDKDGIRFPEYIQSIMGERDDANSHLVPKALLNYGMDKE